MLARVASRSLPTATLLASLLPLACSTGQVDEGGDTFNQTSLDEANDRDTEGSGTDHGTEGSLETGETGEPMPTCGDGMANQGETDVDCGGPNCGPCGDGGMCAQNSDCASQSCVGGVCGQASCSDGVMNQDETAVDCGGSSCPVCGEGFGCEQGSDCESGVCMGGVCSPPSCGDAVLNGQETDVDCGGADCMGCSEGELCTADGDCLSQYCMGGACAPADCLTDADCGAFATACTAGVCTPDKTCMATPANEGGGCDDGNLCITGETCSAGTCGGGAAIDCSGLSNQCNVGTCNPGNGQCVAQAANQGAACNDNKTCTVGEVCNAGTCADPADPGYIFFDDFDNNAAGWSLGTEWAIGSTAASACASTCPGNDPATDHTPTADNGVAGALLGSCISIAVHADYCMTSPFINTAQLPGPVWLSYWRHLHADYPPYMNTTVQVANGGGWTTLWSVAGGACINDAAWTQQAFDVTAYKSASFQVRFCHNIGQAGAFASGGWSIDDLVVGPAQCTPP